MLRLLPERVPRARPLPEVHPAAGRAPRARRAAGRLRAAGARARHRLGDAAGAGAQRRGDRHPARRRAAAARWRMHTGAADQARRAGAPQPRRVRRRRRRGRHQRGRLRLGDARVRAAVRRRARAGRGRAPRRAHASTSACSSPASACARRRRRRARRPPSPTRTPATSPTPRACAARRASCCARSAASRLVEPAEWELCCGSAGTYNVEKPETAAELGRAQGAQPARHRRRPRRHRNIGCLTQVHDAPARARARLPVLHTVQVLDRAYARRLRWGPRRERGLGPARGPRRALAHGDPLPRRDDVEPKATSSPAAPPPPSSARAVRRAHHITHHGGAHSPFTRASAKTTYHQYTTMHYPIVGAHIHGLLPPVCH